MLHPQLGDDALEKLALDYMDIEEDESTIAADVDYNVIEGNMDEGLEKEAAEKADVDVEALESPPPIFMTPPKKKTFKVKERLTDGFLRRSKRISNKLQGSKDIESA
jgi:hypothetical protein